MNMRKVLLGGLVGTAAIGASLALASSATADTVPTATSCTPVSAHTEYKWVPDLTNAGPTQWTTKDAAAGIKATFAWKGANVAYHRDGTKTQFIAGVTCSVIEPIVNYVTEPMFNYDVNTCSVTVPYTPGLDTRLYGVPGHPETDPITHDVTIKAGLDGAVDTAAQFWIGYTAQSGYVDANTGMGTRHIDFYNGDYVADCIA